MRDLKEFFLETLTQRIDTLQAALSADLESDSEDEATIRRVAHGIRGAGGTYGFPELSELAAGVELAPAAELRARATELIEELVLLTQSATSKQNRVLLIDDNDDDARAISTALGASGRSVRRVRTAAEANRVLNDERFQLIVLDLALPDLDGRNLLLRLSEQFRTFAVPVIVATGEQNPRLEVECYRLGAVHAFRKPVDLEVLSAAAGAAIERAEQSDRVSAVDPLTGLPNRAGFHETLRRSVSLCSRNDELLSIAVLDIDRFKAINDTQGHIVGDEVLCRVAEILKRRTRKSDYVARWGGEEFVALFYGSGGDGATLALERLRSSVKSERFSASDCDEFRVTFSAGVVEVRPEATAAETIAEADRLLYQAKSAGRDRIVNSRTVLSASRARVLLAEDDGLVAEAVSRALREKGYDVVHARDAEAALEVLDRREIDLGILDVNMPGISGFELLARIRRLPKHHDTPFLMLTGRDAERDIVRGFELGADDYVVKPFSAPELAARVDRLARTR